MKILITDYVVTKYGMYGETIALNEGMVFEVERNYGDRVCLVRAREELVKVSATSYRPLTEEEEFIFNRDFIVVKDFKSIPAHFEEGDKSKIISKKAIIKIVAFFYCEDSRAYLPYGYYNNSLYQVDLASVVSLEFNNILMRILNETYTKKRQ